MGWQLTEEAPVGTQIMSNVSVMLMRGRTDQASSVGSTPASAKGRVQSYACTVEVRPRLVATGGGSATFPSLLLALHDGGEPCKKRVP